MVHAASQTATELTFPDMIGNMHDMHPLNANLFLFTMFLDCVSRGNEEWSLTSRMQSLITSYLINMEELWRIEVNQ